MGWRDYLPRQPAFSELIEENMSEFFSNYFFPGPALAVLGIYVALVNYFNWDEFAKASVQFGLTSANTLPGLVGILASMIRAAGFLCVVLRRR